MQKCSAHLNQGQRGQQGFTLVDVMAAAMLVAVFLSGAFYANSRGLNMLRCSKETIHASKVLQERLETIRTANWTEVTDSATIRAFYDSAPTGCALNGRSEKITLTPWPPAAVTPLVVTRGTTGLTAIVTDNDDLVDQYAILATVQVSWKSANNRVRTRETATVIANGGLGR